MAGFGRGAEVPQRGYEDLSRRDIATDVFSAFRNSGFSDAQARSLTAEINRENSMQQKYLFGSHPDPANKATNVGMLSWQGDRAPQVMDFLRERGALSEDGSITPGFDALQAQTDFIRHEMENNPSYARTREEFLSNPDVDRSTAARVLGDDYIRWRRTDPEYSGSGYGRINEGYTMLEGEGGEGVSARSVLGSRRPESRPEGLAALFSELEDRKERGRGDAIMRLLSSVMEGQQSSAQAPEVSLRPRLSRGDPNFDPLRRFD
jgi:hypothetical protein